jgi:hypothetical protein
VGGLEGFGTRYAGCRNIRIFLHASLIAFPDDPSLPPLSSRLTFVRLLLELSLFAPALTVLQDILAVDDEEVEAWYLEGWCLFLMAQRSKETGEKVEDLSWEELARDALECLHTCRTVRVAFIP